MTDEESINKGSAAASGQFGSQANVRLTEGSRGSGASTQNVQVPQLPQSQGTVQAPKKN